MSEPTETSDPVLYMIGFVAAHHIKIFTDPAIDAEHKQKFAAALRANCYDECLTIARFCRRMYKARSFDQEVLSWE